MKAPAKSPAKKATAEKGRGEEDGRAKIDGEEGDEEVDDKTAAKKTLVRAATVAKKAAPRRATADAVDDAPF